MCVCAHVPRVVAAVVATAVTTGVGVGTTVLDIEVVDGCGDADGCGGVDTASMLVISPSTHWSRSR